MSNKKPGKIDKEGVEEDISSKVQDQEEEGVRRKGTSAVPEIPSVKYY